MSIAEPTTRSVGIGVPRSLVIADAWSGLSGVEPFTGRTGLPLARTVKLLLDPLVIRPMRNPHLATALVSVEAAAELRGLLSSAGDDLRAAAAWFTLLKRARRAARITEGNPQDLYFQRAYELARLHGTPGTDAAPIVSETLADVHDGGRLTAAELRAYVTDPRTSGELRALIERTWAAARRASAAVPTDEIARFLDTCANEPDDGLFDALVARRTGTAAAAGLDAPGAARGLGLSDRDRIALPEVGDSASKSALPPPFDRSILQRLFAALSAIAETVAGRGSDALPELVRSEVDRSSGAWQLAHEESRMLLTAASHATSSLAADAEGSGADDPGTDAARRLLGRWRREPFVHRALRLPDDAGRDVTEGVREAVMRRLWVRAHGRELRGEPLGAAEVWDVIDGALRSVILDRRDRVKASIEREARASSDATAGGRP